MSLPMSFAFVVFIFGIENFSVCIQMDVHKDFIIYVYLL